MRKLRCILLDDDEDNLEFLNGKLSILENVEVVAVYNDPKKFMDSFKLGALPQYNLLITDIEMPGLDGFDVASVVDPVQVLFVTGYPEKGIDYSTAQNAIGAIKKPVKVEALKHILGKLIPDNQRIVLRTDKWQAHEIDIESISFVKTVKDEPRDKQICFRDGSAITAKNITLEELVSLIGSPHFFKIGRDEAIHAKHVVTRPSKHEVGLCFGKVIEVLEANPDGLGKLRKAKPNLFDSK